jgi:hypothetical protein
MTAAPKNRFAVEIIANDNSKKGIASSRKGFKGLADEVNRYDVAVKRAGGSSFGKAFSGIVKSTVEVEKATAKAFGSRSVFGGVASKLGEIREAGSAAASGMTRAAQAGSGLGAVMGGVIGTAGIMTGVLVAAGVAGFKFVDGWANSTASLGRLSKSLGMASKDLQLFQGAGEQFGVDKDTMSGAVGGIGAAIYGIQTGTNQDALVLQRQWDLKINAGKDGLPDVKDFALQLADATAKYKNPYSQAQFASIFGFQGALPAFRGGSAPLKDAMAYTEKNGAVASDELIAKGTRFQRDKVRAQQVLEKDAMDGAGMTAGPIDKVVRGFGAASIVLNDAVRGDFKPASQALGRAAAGLEALISRTTIGGRLHNPMNIRPVGGAGFQHFDTDEAGIQRAAHQLLLDQYKHGARTPYELLAGRMGADGKRRWGYAPASDGNDPDSYAREVGGKMGIGRDGQLNLQDPHQLAAMLSAMIFRETHNRVSPDKLLPIAEAAERGDRRIVLELQGLPPGAQAKVKSQKGATLAIAQAMPAGHF